MKFKLDENFGTRARQLFLTAGHEVLTVRDEGLIGVPDRQLYDVCCHEQCCLVTLDLDFSDVTRFPPRQTGGIVVIRVPKNPSLSLLENLIEQFTNLLARELVENGSGSSKLGGSGCIRRMKMIRKMEVAHRVLV